MSFQALKPTMATCPTCSGDKEVPTFKGSYIKKMRQRHGITIEALAAAHGCTRQFVWLVETGQRLVPIGLAVALDDLIVSTDRRTA